MQKIDKSMFIQDDKKINDLPEQCKTCYGYSAWDGDINLIKYPDRDCSGCSARPDGF